MLWIVFDLDTPISLLLVICLLVLLFAVSVVGCLLGSSSCLVVWIPLFLDPSDGAFGRFDLAALCGCRTLNFCLFLFHLDVWTVARRTDGALAPRSFTAALDATTRHVSAYVIMKRASTSVEELLTGAQAPVLVCPANRAGDATSY